MRYKSILFIVFLLSTQNSFSQDKVLDYFVDKKGDTIYGMIRNGLLKTAVLIEENKDKNLPLIYKSHTLKKAQSVRYQGELFQIEKKEFNDGIYQQDEIDTTLVIIRNGDFVSRQTRLKDFLILKTNDTIYGTIRNPIIGGLFIEKNGEKTRIERDHVKSYRFNNEVFELKEKPRLEIFDKNQDYLKVLINDKMKLYFYESSRYRRINNIDYVRSDYMLIEKNGKMIYVNPTKFSATAREIFSDCPEIIEKLNKDYFFYEDLYSMVILYNYYMKNK